MSVYENIDLFPISVDVIKSYENNLPDRILVWGLDTESRTNLAIIDSYRPSFYIELNRRMCSTEAIWQRLHIIVKMWLEMKDPENRPIHVEHEFKYKFQYYQHQQTRFLRVYYTNIKCATKAVNMLKQPQYVKVGHYNLGQVGFTVHEGDFNEFNIALRMMADPRCNFTYSGWQVMRATPVLTDNRISKRAIEWRVDYQAIVPASTITISPNPVVMSYDIETNTPDYKKFMPKSELIECTCYQITFYVGRLGTPKSEHKRRIVVVADHTINKELEDKGAEIINLKDESNLIETYCNAIEEFDPDIITGFNILFYDNTYLEDRRKIWMTQWTNCSRLKDATVEMKNLDFSGVREKYLFVCPGRITVDVFTYAIKNLKLKYYSLSAVAYNKLNEKKKDVPYEEQFVAYNAWVSARDELENMMIRSQTRFIRMRIIIEAMYPHYYKWITANSDMLLAQNENLWIEGLSTLQSVAKTLIEQLQAKRACYNVPDNDVVAKYIVAQHLLYRVMDYGDQDAYLPYHLFERLGIFLNVSLMGKVNNVNAEQIYTRGKQLCCLHMIYMTAKTEGYVVDKRTPIKYHIGGGFVKDPIPGYYPKTATLDFGSLYPSIIRDKNLCYCTLLPEGEVPPGVDYETIAVPIPEHNVTYVFRWARRACRMGVLVILEERLIAERKAVREKQKQYSKDSLEWKLLEEEQNALKVACNSVYGFLGVGCNLDKDKNKQKNVVDFQAREYFSKMPLPEASNCITYCGRSYIQQVMTALEEMYPDIVIVYGDTDSVMFYIPSITDNYIDQYRKVCDNMNALMPEFLVLEMENVSDIVQYGKKNYVKFIVKNDGSPLLDHNGNQEVLAKGVPKARRDRSKALIEIHDYATLAIHHRMNNIQLYRWIINHIMQLIKPGRDLENYEIIKSYNSAKDGGNKVIVSRMKAYGKEIQSGDRFGYLIADTRLRDNKGKVVRGSKRPKKSDAAFELGVYRQLLKEGRAPPIDYFYYVDALVKPIDKVMNIVPRLPECYKVIRFARHLNACVEKDFIFFVDKPVKMIATMVNKELNLDLLMKFFDDITIENGL